MENRRIKILAVDDNRDNLVSIKALIAEAFSAASVFTALDGKSALAAAKKEDPDIILLDIVMPGMDGFAVCRKLKETKALREIPVIFLTALKGDRENRIFAMECGAEAFLAKPIDKSELTAQIRAMARIREANVAKRKEKERLARLVREKTRALRKENEERKRSEQDLLEAQSLAHIGSFEFDLERSVLTCTDEGLRICGIRREDFAGAPDTIIRCIHPSDRDSALRASEQAVLEKKATAADCRLIRPDGEERIVCVRYTPVMDASGKPLSVQGTVQDITEQNRAQKALRESEEKHRLLVTQMIQGLAVHEVILDSGGKPIDFRFLDVNPSFEKIAGMKRENIIGKTLLELFPKTENYWIEKCGQVALTGVPQVYENFAGALGRYYEVVAYCPQPKQVAVIFTDITDRKAAEDALRGSEEKHRLLVTQMLQGLAVHEIILDREGNPADFRFLDVNPSFEKITGLKREDIIGKKLLEMLPEYDRSLIEKYARVALTGEPLIYENYTKELGRYYEVVAYCPQPKQVAVIFTDITERKAAEDALRGSEEKHRLLVTQMLQGLAVHEIILDREGNPVDYRFLDANPSFEKITGLKREDIIGKTVLEIFPGAETAWIEKCGQVALTGKPQVYENYSEEIGRYYEAVAYRPQPKQFAIIFTDITDRKAAEDALRESEQKYSSYIENAPDAVFVTDENGNYIEANRAACEITGYSKEELLQMTIRDITADGYIKEGINFFNKVTRDGSMKGMLQYKHKDGSNRWWTIDAVKLTKNRFLGFSKDVTDRKKAEDELVHLSYHDQLTGLYNRRFFEEELKRLDTGRNLPLSIVMGDINGLKVINDSFGYESGDTYLKKTAEIIRKACRSDDIIARLGGDEFAVLLVKSDHFGAGKLVKRIEDLILKEEVGRIQLSVSFGYETKINAEQSIADILANAENHKYTHKVYEHASTRSKTIDVIMNALFEKSSRESQHSKRVSALCRAIAAEMNFEKDDINQIRIAGLVHDIGKIGIDEKILNKKERLSDFEWGELKKHPEAGWRILNSMPEFSEIAQFVLDHHEKFDGSGYPNGLKGKEIPIEARIITVSDSYDAMTSKRSYRDAISKEQAVREIIRCSGTHFDPKIVDVFVKKVLPRIGTLKPEDD
jgi:diguanylate cyclase (GGDEF)-like protein/PAS domain S-box-containing protein